MIRGFNLDETKNFEREVNRLREKIESDNEYKNKILQNKSEYDLIKNFFEKKVRFLKYPIEVEIECLYRVRKLDSKAPFSNRDEVIYPPPNCQHQDRMNNMSFRVLYVSLHEFTAMAETRIDKSYIGNYFQLTKFTINRKFRAYKLGQFSELHFNTPRDSKHAKKKMSSYFGSPDFDGAVQGYSALECAVADVLYDQKDEYYILSSIMADAIFSSNPSIEAIMYPSIQNRYGTNLALKKCIVDELKISYTAVNQIKEVYSNGFFKYRTIQECSNANSDEFIFSPIEGECQYR